MNRRLSCIQVLIYGLNFHEVSGNDQGGSFDASWVDFHKLVVFLKLTTVSTLHDHWIISRILLPYLVRI